TVTIDGDRLRDRHGAEAARIEDADLSVRGGLADRACERLAGSGAAAGIGVVADTRHPGTGRLSLRHRSEAKGQDGDEDKNESLAIHEVLLETFQVAAIKDGSPTYTVPRRLTGLVNWIVNGAKFSTLRGSCCDLDHKPTSNFGKLMIPAGVRRLKELSREDLNEFVTENVSVLTEDEAL